MKAASHSPSAESSADSNQAIRLAALIQEDIYRQGLVPGAHIGTKPGLAARYGVGPEIFRQAASILEQRGIAEMQRGKLGGLVVTEPRPDAAAHVLATFFEFANVPFADFHAVNEPLQIVAYEAAAHAVSLRQADSWRRRLLGMAESEIATWHGAFLSVDIRQEMVDSIGNPILSLLHQAMSLFFMDMIPLDRLDGPEGAESLRLHLRQTSDLIEAIIANDVQSAHRISQETSEFTSAREVDWRRMEDRFEIDRAKVDRGPKAGRWTVRWTLADKVAREILRNIRSRGWPEGTYLGTEADLIQAYGVSRATFRQAVRLLEHYSAAKMQRGSKGGLLVTAPDAEGVVELVVQYLLRAKVTFDHARPSQIALQTTAIGLLCGAISRSALEDYRRRWDTLLSLRGEDLRVGLGGLQAFLVEQTGNRVLRTYWSILVAIAAPAGIPEDIADDRILAVASHILPALGEALAAGDRTRARRAMINYLAEETCWLRPQVERP